MKGGAKPRGQEAVRRNEERQRRIAEVDQFLELLVNPFDQMSITEKKELALFLFYRRLQVNNQKCANFVEMQ